MGDIFVLFIRAANGIMLAKFYSAFLTPKLDKIPKSVIFAGFGFVYFISQYLLPKILLLFGFGAATGVPYHILAIANFIILLAIVFFLSLILFKTTLGMQIFLLSSFLAVQEISFFITHAINSLMGDVAVYFTGLLFKWGAFSTVETALAFQKNFIMSGYIIQMLLYFAIIFLSLKMISKNFLYKNQTFSMTELLYIILPSLTGLSLVSILKAMITKTDESGNYEVYAGVPFAEFLIPLAGFVFLFGLIAAVKLFQKLAELHDEERERIVLEQQTQLLQEQVRGIDGIYKEIRGMRHDMKSHISNIKLLIETVAEGNPNAETELEQYLGQFGAALDKFDFAFQTGNSISDVIIHQKYIEAVNNGIEFSADFIYPAQLDLDAYDLAVILNNALENAIEACNGMVQANRFIRLYSYTKGEMFFIEVENSFTGHITIKENSELPVSGKADKELHGIGLSNIQRCARKYYGDINVQTIKKKSYSIFHLIVMLQGRA